MPRTDYDLLDFDARDDLDAHAADVARALVFDLPARPGTIR